MTPPEKARFSQLAIDKIAEVAIASQLKQVEKLKVHIDTALNKLARGKIDSINININGLLIQPYLILEELQLKINSVTVKPRSAILGKIKLVHPAVGTIYFVFNQDDLTRAFNCESFLANIHQIGKTIAINLQQVKCALLADGKISLRSELILSNTEQARIAFTVVPQISNDGRKIYLQDVHYLEGEALAPELTAALLLQVSELLSLRMFERKGMLLRIQQVDVTAGKLILQADTYIEQFPTA